MANTVAEKPSIAWEKLSNALEGELFTDNLHKTIYATDASVYREIPAGVVFPKSPTDLTALVHFSKVHGLSLIPRTAGTSLAGQCVGDGLVVDFSKYFTEVLEINTEEGYVVVQPGVIRDELNAVLKPLGFFFGPNTSTANRCMMGGMVGNNSCGSTSIRYGTTRDKLLGVKAILSNGQKAHFTSGGGTEYAREILDSLRELVSESEVKEWIQTAFPPKEIHRRNTGYALDVYSEDLNPLSLLAGSEGTLCLTYEIKLKIDPLPPPKGVLICGHFSSIHESMVATKSAMELKPYSCELMDKTILDLTKKNALQAQNRFFVEGDPAAVLIVELRAETEKELSALKEGLLKKWKKEKLGYAYPEVAESEAHKVWDLRKAGLGLLSNIPGDAKPVACIEDTAVTVEDLPSYIDEFEELMKGFGQEAIYYAHAGAGELHLRPILNLKTKDGQQQFREISEATARLVKKYNGSLSGEHGDGRVRAEFIPIALGEEALPIFKRVKEIWDPQYLFNPGKIVDAPAMNESLRYEENQFTPTYETAFDFSEDGGIVQLAEKCNGTAACRKTEATGGTMCPSYMATRDEKDSTRARANALREYLSRQSTDGTNPFKRKELNEVLDLCLSCKGCTSECPSNVDMTTLKSEYQYQKNKGSVPSIRTLLMGHIDALHKWGGKIPKVFNALSNGFMGRLGQQWLGIHPSRSLPNVSSINLRKWYKTQRPFLESKNPNAEIYLFVDEFTEHLDAEMGQQALEVFWKLGIRVHWPQHTSSGRAQFSKGLLDTARKKAEKNIKTFSSLIDEKTPLVGLEPSAILSFRDEYPKITRGDLSAKAKELAKNTMTFEEFMAQYISSDLLDPSLFSNNPIKGKIHGHCHQKSLSQIHLSQKIINALPGVESTIIPSGCCGMAGSFGYEEEHFDVSQKVGELVLFPTARKMGEDQFLIAAGTSCRHQIADGVNRLAIHPASFYHLRLR